MSIHDNISQGKYRNRLEFFETTRDIYRAETNRLDAQFRADLEAEHGLANHPKADKIYSLAWEYGHSAGYIEVALYYEDLIELIR